MTKTLTLKKDAVQIGDNIQASETEDGKLILIIDPTQELGLSASGKSMNVATTRGNISVGKLKLGLNLYKPVR